MSNNLIINKDLKSLMSQIPHLEVEDKREEMLSNRVLHIQENSNIPKRYLKAKLEPITPEQEKLKEKFKEAFNGKKNDDKSDLLIYGSVGTGKTHLVIGLLNLYISKGHYCRYVTEHELLELYKQKDFNKFNSFKTVELLVIDEMGKRELAEWERNQIEEFISHRYMELKTTIYITNMNQQDFKEFVGDRVIDRLRDNKVITVTMKGESLRGQNV